MAANKVKILPLSPRERGDNSTALDLGFWVKEDVSTPDSSIFNNANTPFQLLRVNQQRDGDVEEEEEQDEEEE